jgi:serine/threonine protein kinase
LQEFPYHPHIIQLYTHFVSEISESIEELLTELADDGKLELILLRSQDVGPLRPSRFIVMEYLPTTLQAIASTCSLQEKLEILSHVADSLIFLWQQHVVHRDLKLDNILVEVTHVDGKRRLRGVLIDFGLATRVDAKDGTARVQEPGGNQQHLAPEVLDEFRRQTERERAGGRDRGRHRGGLPVVEFLIDYRKQASFALGTVVHELLCGQPPFPDYPRNYHGQRMSLTQLTAVNAPAAVIELCRGLLLRNPSRRTTLQEAYSCLSQAAADQG